MSLVGPLLLINGLGAVIVLYWGPDGSNVQVGNLIELLVQRRLCRIFC